MKRLFWIILVIAIVALFGTMGLAVADYPDGFRAAFLNTLGGTGSAIYLTLEGILIAAGTTLNSVHPWLSHIAIIPTTLILVYVTRWAWQKRSSLLHHKVPQSSVGPAYQTQMSTPELYAQSTATPSATPTLVTKKEEPSIEASV